MLSVSIRGGATRRLLEIEAGSDCWALEALTETEAEIRRLSRWRPVGPVESRPWHLRTNENNRRGSSEEREQSRFVLVERFGGFAEDALSCRSLGSLRL